MHASLNYCLCIHILVNSFLKSLSSYQNLSLSVYAYAYDILKSQRTTERKCLKKLFEWNTYGVCGELPDQVWRGYIAVKNGSHEETDAN